MMFQPKIIERVYDLSVEDTSGHLSLTIFTDVKPRNL